MNLTPWIIDAAVAAAAFAATVIGIRRFGPRLGPRLQRSLGEAYQQRILGQLKARYPDLAARFGDLDLSGPDAQARIQRTWLAIPPQEQLKIQQELLRLKDGFLGRHPGVGDVVGDFQSGDARRQAKAVQALLKFPEPERKALSKDLIWAVDQFQGRFPRWYRALLGALKPAGTAEPVKAGKKK